MDCSSCRRHTPSKGQKLMRVIQELCGNLAKNTTLRMHARSTVGSVRICWLCLQVRYLTSHPRVCGLHSGSAKSVTRVSRCRQPQLGPCYQWKPALQRSDSRSVWKRCNVEGDSGALYFLMQWSEEVVPSQRNMVLGDPRICTKQMFDLHGILNPGKYLP